ncbi:MAG: penicillin-binding protein 1C [Flavobacteriales bacterium]|nr:MAG: penicillin-binding protein 1C [Flavobacteriales bacterium]
MRRAFSLLKKHKIKTIILLVLLVWYYFALPKELFSEPTATVIESAEGNLLSAVIAKDQQWRFPKSDSVPYKFKKSIIAFEDSYFYRHPGFNPVSIGKAFWQNMQAGSIKRGGSTLTQQVIRLSRKGKSRTYFEKTVELILATRLELRHTKNEILGLYAAHAPFGGNVVGLEMAAWRYFGRSAAELSWAESATLAVLPNAPGLIFPGSRQDQLRHKRNRLLEKLYREETIDSLTYSLATMEPLPQKPYPLPQNAPHLLQYLRKKFPGKRIRTTINNSLQKQTNAIVVNHYKLLSQNQIFNIAVLVMDVNTRKILAYVGNAPTDKAHEKDVNIIHKPRSTGSILKPFLYTAMLDAGEILPHTLVADIPTQIANYNPQNFDLQYDGAVPASVALSRSLNVPAVRMLQDFGLDRFYFYLQKMHLKDISKTTDYYGLSLILGGAESNLWDLCKTYAAFSSTINHYSDMQGKYFSNEFVEPILNDEETIDFGKITKEKTLFDAGSMYLTYNALKEVNRPAGEENWEFFDSSKEIAWKTGTSFGFKDAWAIGSTKDYLVGVWVGNADGEGRPGLTGIKAAAPILFDVFGLLPRSNWFDKPYDELSEIAVCKTSGYRANKACTEVDTLSVPTLGLKTRSCPYHHTVHLDKNEQFRVNASCYPLENIKSVSWFTLPPLQAFYYRQKHPDYKELPPFKLGCKQQETDVMDFIYPKENAKIFLPKNFDEQVNKVVFKLAHNTDNIKVFWYLDNHLVATTEHFHELALEPTIGKHTITVVDETGFQLTRTIEIVE